MKTPPHALRAGLLLAALIPFASLTFAADPAAPEAPMRELGAASAAPTPTPTAAPSAHHSHAVQPGSVVHQFDDDDNNRVSVSDSTVVNEDETVPGNAVAVLGPITVNGTVNGNAVAVVGSGTINGTVHGNVVVVLGNMHLGPHAHVDGNVVGVVGMVERDPGAYVGGQIVKQGGGVDFSEDSGAFSWWKHAFSRGRPLAVAPHLHLFWLLSICTIAIYLLLALVFPGGVTRCGDVLIERPGLTLLTGILAIIALPVVFILLLITVVGIPIALVVLPISVMAAVTFGKGAIYALVGRSILGKKSHPVLATLLGVALIIGFLLVPVIGGLIWIIMGFLGYACAVTALFASRKAAPGTPPSPTPPPAPGPTSGVIPAVPLDVPGASPLEAASAAPPVMPAIAVTPPVLAAPRLGSEAALPRAGFWIRIVALLIDFILVGIVVRMHDWFPVALAIYAAILWKIRGATIGDIIFGLKVVRADGAPLEWVTAIVRALACFFSVIVVGLGFIWIAFDREKQGWHDKIAGTLVVRLPRGSSLV